MIKYIQLNIIQPILNEEAYIKNKNFSLIGKLYLVTDKTLEKKVVNYS